MLIRFSVANCLSFNEKTSLELFASKDRNLKEQLWISSSRHIPNILKAAFIFGPNAGGKSNLIKAIHYAKALILREPNPLWNRSLYFKLCPDCVSKPSFFEFELLIKKKIYRYGFETKNSIIEQEWLYLINSTGEHLVYRRSYDEVNKNQISYGEKFKDYDENDLFHFILRGTPANQLLLSELIERNQDIFKEVYQWFKKIVIIYPDTRLQSYNILVDNELLLNEYRRLMYQCDMGIDQIELRKVEFDNVLEKLPVQLKDKLRLEQLKSLALEADERYTVDLEDGKREAHKIEISHKMPSTGESVSFKISEESDGTNRFFDLIPILALAEQDALILIDELDRSMHPNVIKHFIRSVFEANKGHQAQMVVTTHESTLLDVKLLRRDAIYFIKKAFQSSSEIYSLYDFMKVRNDKSLQKAYLEGLYGAVPMIEGEG